MTSDGMKAIIWSNTHATTMIGGNAALDCFSLRYELNQFVVVLWCAVSLLLYITPSNTNAFFPLRLMWRKNGNGEVMNKNENIVHSDTGNLTTSMTGIPLRPEK
jgi:hypothetical protein